MKLFELRLKMGDLQQARAFYHDVLKLPILEETAELLALQAGSTRLVFEREADWNEKYHFAFDIPENQIEQAAEWISRRAKLATLNGTTIFKSSDHWNSNMVYFYDPAGNILEFIARHNQANAAREPFSERGILSISEIGLATQNVRETVNWLCETLELKIYDGAGSDTFSAVGDELGLFIVVKEGRVWYPETGIHAGLNAVEVTLLEGKGGDYNVPGLPYHIVQLN